MTFTTRFLLGAAVLALASCSATNRQRDIPPDGSHAEIGVLETTDLHSNVMSYDYYKLSDDPSLGLERTATLIRDARRQFENSLLFDAGEIGRASCRERV